MTWPNFGTDVVMMTSQALFKKATSCKRWTKDVGMMVKDLAKIGVIQPKFGTDDVMMIHKSWTIKVGIKAKDLTMI